MSNEEIVMFDSDAAATLHNTGLCDIWRSRHGKCFIGAGAERLARYDGCTHTWCSECGQVPVPKTYCSIRCPSCRGQRREKEWLAMPVVEWDGVSVVCEFDSDRYFSSPEEAIDEAEAENVDPATLRIQACKRSRLRRWDAYDLVDDLPEDYELPEAALAAVDALNKALEEIVLYEPAKGRIDIGKHLSQEQGAGES